MAQMNRHEVQSEVERRQFHFPEKALQLLLSVSVFSFLFSYSSSILPTTFSIHSLNHCLSTFSITLFSCTTDRNYIFLLCNGILVILITNSGFITKSPLPTDFKDDDHVENNSIGDTQRTLLLQLSQTKAMVMEEEEEEEEEEEVVNEIEEEQEEGNGILQVAVASGEDGLLMTIQNEEEEDEEEGNGLWSTEELNKKCDDFIKRMREGIKRDAGN